MSAATAKSTADRLAAYLRQNKDRRHITARQNRRLKKKSRRLAGTQQT